MRITRLLPAVAGIIMIVVVGLPMALWVGFPALAPVLAAPLLNARDIELIQLEVTRPDLRGITVRSLQLQQVSAGLVLRGDDIRIAWEHPLRGIGNRPTSVLIGQLDVTFDPPPDGPDPKAPSSSAWAMPTALLAGLPTRNLKISALTARSRIAGKAIQGAGTLHVSTEDAVFSGVVHADALPAPVAVRARVHPGDHVSIRVETAAVGGAFLALDGALSTTSKGPAFAGAAHLDLDGIQHWLDAPAPWPTGALDLQLAASLEPEPTLTLQPGSKGHIQLQQTDTVLAITLALAEPLGLTFTAGTPTFASGTLPLQVQAQHEAWSMEGDFEVADIQVDTRGQAMARVVGSGRASWPDGSGAFDIRMPLRTRIAPLRVELAADTEVVLQDLRHHQAGLAEVRIHNTAPIGLNAEGLLDLSEWEMTVDDPARLELTGRVRVNPAGDIDAHIEEATLPLTNNDLLAMLLPASAAPRSGRIDISGEIQRSAAGVVEADLQTQWQNAGMDLTAARVRGASGAATLDYADGALHIASAATTVHRIEWIRPEGPQATILMQSMQVSGSGELGLRFHNGVGTSFELGAVAIRAELASERITQRELSAQEVEVEARINGDARRPTLEGRLRLASAAVGVPVRDVLCDFDTQDLKVWQFTDCRASLLGGEVNLPQGDFNLATGSGYMPLAVTGLQLSAVLGLMQDPALDGTGILDGSLPLRLQAMNPLIEQGWLAVRPPGGVLAYVASANILAGIDQPAMRLTLRAVRDLRYQRLESRVDYTEDGTLTLAVNLLGSNPEIEGGRPIQLNLNVTQNLLTLLQSLRLSENIERELQRRMQRVQP